MYMWANQKVYNNQSSSVERWYYRIHYHGNNNSAHPVLLQKVYNLCLLQKSWKFYSSYFFQIKYITQEFIPTNHSKLVDSWTYTQIIFAQSQLKIYFCKTCKWHVHVHVQTYDFYSMQLHMFLFIPLSTNSFFKLTKG